MCKFTAADVRIASALGADCCQLDLQPGKACCSQARLEPSLNRYAALQSGTAQFMSCNAPQMPEGAEGIYFVEITQNGVDFSETKPARIVYGYYDNPVVGSIEPQLIPTQGATELLVTPANGRSFDITKKQVWCKFESALQTIEPFEGTFVNSALIRCMTPNWAAINASAVLPTKGDFQFYISYNKVDNSGGNILVRLYVLSSLRSVRAADEKIHKAKSYSASAVELVLPYNEEVPILIEGTDFVQIDSQMPVCFFGSEARTATGIEAAATAADARNGSGSLRCLSPKSDYELKTVELKVSMNNKNFSYNPRIKVSFYCPLGHYRDSSTNETSNPRTRCRACPAGDYVDVIREFQQCQRCSKGYYSASLSATSKESCIKCGASDPMEYCPLGGMNGVRKCPLKSQVDKDTRTFCECGENTFGILEPVVNNTKTSASDKWYGVQYFQRSSSSFYNELRECRACVQGATCYAVGLLRDQVCARSPLSAATGTRTHTHTHTHTHETHGAHSAALTRI